MIKTLTKKTTIFLLCFTLVFSVVSVDYIERKEVHAMEYLGGLTFDALLPWLLGLLGITISKEYVEQQGSLENACKSLAQAWENWFELKNGAQEDLREWTVKLIAGTLVQGVVKTTSVWSLFKQWAQTLFKSDSVSGNKVTVSSDNVFGIDSFDYFQVNLSDLSTKYYFNDTDYFIISSADSSILNNKYTIVPFYNSSTSSYSIPLIFSNVHIYTGLVVKAYVNGSLNGTYRMDQSFGLVYYDKEVHCIKSFPATPSLTYQKQGWLSVYGDSYSSDKVLDSARPDIGKTGFITPDATTQVLPNSVPIDLSQLGVDAAAIAQAYARLYAAYLAGQLTLEKLCALVQELLRVRTVEATDEATDEAKAETTFPDGQPVAPIIEQNVSNGEFTLSGLEKVFPFCIPWDIKDFVTLLVAEPVAPVINYPIYNPVTKQNINITIDFSEWETVVIVFRYILDFLLIIGLLLLARQLAGAGGDD